MAGARIRLNALDGVKWLINRDEVYGGITLTLTWDDGVVDVNLGRTSEDAESLHASLQEAADVAKLLVDEWEDMPEDYDAFIVEDDGRYYVRLENQQRDETGFPTKEMAMIELAEWMVELGTFPAAWFQYSAYTQPINDEIRELHDDGGDGMKPLVGVQFEHNDDVVVNHRYQTGPMTWVNEWMSAIVIRDYGEAGVRYYFYGLESDGDYVIEDRDDIKPAPKEDEDET